jgi:hypothetical protein
VLLNGRHLALAPLERTEDGYRFNPRTFEAAIRPGTRLFILSHPHNPTGNVWSAAELTAMGEICARHDVLVISDEIHQDLIINPAPRHRRRGDRVADDRPRPPAISTRRRPDGSGALPAPLPSGRGSRYFFLPFLLFLLFFATRTTPLPESVRSTIC